MTSSEDEEIHEIQEDDRELFSDQLASIGTLGRVAADHCIPLLTRCPHTQNLRHNFERRYSAVGLSTRRVTSQ